MSYKIKKLSDRDFNRFINLCEKFKKLFGLTAELYYTFDELEDGVYAVHSFVYEADSAHITLNKNMITTTSTYMFELENTAFHEVGEIYIRQVMESIKLLDSLRDSRTAEKMEEAIIHGMIHNLWRLYEKTKSK